MLRDWRRMFPAAKAFQVSVRLTSAADADRCQLPFLHSLHTFAFAR